MINYEKFSCFIANADDSYVQLYQLLIVNRTGQNGSKGTRRNLASTSSHYPHGDYEEVPWGVMEADF